MLSIDENCRNLFVFYKEPREESTEIRVDPSTDRASYSNYRVSDVKLKQACIKFENYMRAQNLTLGVVFAILDRNVNDSISISEFRSQIHQMKMNLEEDEIMALFKSIDVNNSQSITYNELIEKFDKFNVEMLIKRIKVFIDSGSNNADFIFDKYSNRQSSTRGSHSDFHASFKDLRMQQADFAAMVKYFIKKISPPEIAQMFKHFDHGNKGFITRQDFTAAFVNDVKDQGFVI